MNPAFRLLACLFLSACAPLLLLGCKAIGPDRQVLYLSCMQGEHVLVYDIDSTNGKLTERQRIELPGRGGPLALSADGRTLYAALNNPPRVLPMPRDRATGGLSMLTPTPVPHYPTYLDTDATGRFAITATYREGVVNTYRINDDRTIAEGPLQTINTQKSAHASLIDPSNRFVYIPHTLPNAIYQFLFDDDSGRLTPNNPIIVEGGGTEADPQGPRHYCYHPSRSIVYVVNELDSSVSAYAWNKETGTLRRFQSLSTLPPNFAGHNTCADIHATPNGKFLYASNRGHDTIAAYRLDDQGIMSLVGWFKTTPVPREFCIDLSGRFLYAAGLRSASLIAFEIDQRTGRLNQIGRYETPEGPIWVEAVGLE